MAKPGRVAAVAHYGYSRDQYRVMTVYDIRPVEDHERFRQFMQTDHGVHEGEQIWRHRKADGTDIEAAVYYPEDDRYLVERELDVRHYEVDVRVL